jgi:hypothetical protein
MMMSRHTPLDNGERVLLDLSAAFDTTDHKILIDELSYINGGKDTALKCFES